MHRTENGRPLDLLVTLIVGTSFLMLGQLVLGVFKPILAVLFVAGAAGAWVCIFVDRIVWPNRRTLLITLVLGVVALLPRQDPFLYVWGGQDQGIYVAMSAHFGRTQGLSIEDEVRKALPEGDRNEYDRLNQWEQYDADSQHPGAYEGKHQLGTYIKNLKASEYVFQFYPLQPSWMALFADLLGDASRVYALTFFSLLNILMLSLLAYELSGGVIGAGIVLASLLAISPMHVFLSRFPVTENLTVFFSSTAFYYLLRYFKARSAGDLRPWALVLSAAAWGCLFLNHISGFMYGPVLAFIGFAGAATARSRRELQHMLCYGAGVILAYGMSLGYGFTWSFPYSFEIYTAIFGKDIGTFFIAHWKGCILLALSAWIAGCMTIWCLRDPIRVLWNRHLVGRWLHVLLVTMVFLIVAHGLFDAYRLGFTGYYANDEYLEGIYKLSNGGSNAVIHSSIVALGIYLSPFALVFLMAAWLYEWKRNDLYSLGLLLFIVVFLAARTGVESFTYYFYYGRYLGAELVPYMLLATTLVVHRLFNDGGRKGKIISVCIVELGLIWSAGALALQYPGGEMRQIDSSLRPLVRNLDKDDLVILALNKKAFHPLQTSLDYYYGCRTVFVDPAGLDEAVKRYSGSGRWSGVFILSSSRTLPGLQLVQASPLQLEHYSLGRYDILPRAATWSQLPVYLHKVP